MITSIQIHENVKNELDRLKEGKQTYEEVILNIIKTVEQQKRGQKELLIEGCKEMAKENIKIMKEFSTVDNELDWEY
jgi:predicted CopG family antitoxin